MRDADNVCNVTQVQLLHSHWKHGNRQDAKLHPLLQQVM